MVDVVYPVRPGPANEPEHLRYSLRTLWHHVPDVRVWIVGHQPAFIDWDQVGHIPSAQLVARFANQREPELRFANQRANLEAVLEDGPERFWWMNDDYFAVAPVTQLAYYHRGPLRRYLDELPASGDWGAYADGLRFCLKLLESWGYSEPDNYAAHMPVPITRDRLAAVMERAWSDGLEGGFMRALYPVAASDHPHVEVVDPKLKTLDAVPQPDDTWISTSPSAWSQGAAGRLIRNRYWRRSPFEVK